MTRPGRAPTGLFRTYRALTTLLAPLAWQVVNRKLKRAEVSPDRRMERLGHATKRRDVARLLWLHGASVGESLTALSLARNLAAQRPSLSILLTSGTATSAELLARRMPEGLVHQFAPIDSPGPVRRFLDHWRPDAAIFVESELWPVTLAEAAARDIPLALANARLSPRSVDGWSRFPDTAGFVLDRFTTILTQNHSAREGLIRMGADPKRLFTAGNLKAFTDPLPVDPEQLNTMKEAFGERRFWLAASTHPGEEQTLIEAHATLAKRRPDLCLILVPRHPERRDEIARLGRGNGLTLAMRSKNEAPATSVYLADTLGELGLWYALAPFTFLGGSLVDMGGHNPFEPAQAGIPIMTGPFTRNFGESFAPLISAGGAVEVSSRKTIVATATEWLDDPGSAARAGHAARLCADAGHDAFDAICARLIQELRL